MIFKLRYKLFIAFGGFSALLIGIMYFITVLSVSLGFDEFVHEVEMKQLDRLIPNIVRFYHEKGHSWRFLTQPPNEWFQLIEEYLKQSHDLSKLEDSRNDASPSDREKFNDGDDMKYNDWDDMRFSDGDDMKFSDEDYMDELTARKPPLFIYILDKNKQLVFGNGDSIPDLPIKQLTSNGRIIGWIGV